MEIADPPTNNSLTFIPCPETQLTLLSNNSLSAHHSISPEFMIDNHFVYSSPNHISLYSFSTKRYKVIQQFHESQCLLAFQLFKDQQNRILFAYITTQKQKSKLFLSLKYQLENIATQYSLVPLEKGEKIYSFCLLRDLTVLAAMIQTDSGYVLRYANLIDDSYNEKRVMYKGQIIKGLASQELMIVTDTQLILQSLNLSTPQIIIYSSSRILNAIHLSNSILIIDSKGILSCTHNKQNQHQIKRVQCGSLKSKKDQSNSKDSMFNSDIIVARTDINKEYLIIVEEKLTAHILRIEKMETHRIVELGNVFQSISWVTISQKGSNLVICGDSMQGIPSVINFSLDLYFSREQHFYPYLTETSFVFKQVPTQTHWNKYKNLYSTCVGENFNFGSTNQTFTQKPVTYSIHPQGLFVTVGYPHLIKQYGIKNKRLQLLESINAQSIIRLEYSPFGNLIIGHFKSEIRIYNSYTLEKVYSITLRFPASEFLGFQVQEEKNQVFIYDNALGAIVFNFSILKSTREFRLPMAGYPVVYDFHHQILVLIDKERIIISKQNERTYKQTWYDDNAIITSIKISHDSRTIFFGTSNGEIRQHAWFEIPTKQFIYKYNKISLFSSPICSIVSNFNNKQIIAWSYEGQRAIIGLAEQSENEIREREKHKNMVLESKEDFAEKNSKIVKYRNQHLGLNQLLNLTQGYKSQLQQKHEKQRETLSKSSNTVEQLELKELLVKIHSVEQMLVTYSSRMKLKQMEEEYLKELTAKNEYRLQLIEMKQELKQRNYNKMKWITKNYTQKCKNERERNASNIQQLTVTVDSHQQKLGVYENKSSYAEQLDIEIYNALNSNNIEKLRVQESTLYQEMKNQERMEKSNTELRDKINELEWKLICSCELKNQLEFTSNNSYAQLKSKEQSLNSLRERIQIHSKYIDETYSYDRMEKAETIKLRAINITNYMENIAKIHRYQLQKIDGEHHQINIKIQQIQSNLKEEGTILIDLNKKIQLKNSKLAHLKSSWNQKSHSLYMTRYNIKQFSKQLSNLYQQYSNKQASKQTRKKLRGESESKKRQREMIHVRIQMEEKKIETLRPQLNQHNNARMINKCHNENQNLTKVFNTLNLNTKDNEKTMKGLIQRLNKVRLSDNNQDKERIRKSAFKTPFVQYHQSKNKTIRNFQSYNASFNQSYS